MPIMDNHIEQERVEARKALEEITHGTWELQKSYPYHGVISKNGSLWSAICNHAEHGDAHFIANCPTWLRNSLDREEQQEEKIQAFMRSMTAEAIKNSSLERKVAEQDKEIQLYKSALRDSILERDEIIKILYESLEWYAKQDFKPEIAQLALDRINQS